MDLNGQSGIPPGAQKILVWFDPETQTTGVLPDPQVAWNQSFVGQVLGEAKRLWKNLLHRQEIAAAIERQQRLQEDALLKGQILRAR